MSIQGKTRENVEFKEQEKFVGLFEAKIVAVNPTIEQFKTLLNIELKEDSKQTDYLSENKEGNTVLRVDFWLENIKTSDNEFPQRFKKTFFLEDNVRTNKDDDKNQYINTIGDTSWARNENHFKEMIADNSLSTGYRKFLTDFTKRDFREANQGEEKLYGFLRTWLGRLDYRDPDTQILQEWKKLMKGNVKELKDQIDGEYSTSFIALATIKTTEKTDEDGNINIVEYQNIWDEFLPSYLLPNFSKVDYNNAKTISLLTEADPKSLKYFEKFVVNINSQYGCKDYFKLKEISVYNSNENLVTSNEVILKEEENDDLPY